ncbi:MAG TPA: hypothetical protein DCK93_16625 [Blastocatellia bacterium]|nr:hypothetical protein [Blastocatellia bacterium]
MPPVAERHWFAPNTSGELDAHLLSELGMVWVALHLTGRQLDSGRMVDSPVIRFEFQYRHLSEVALEAIEHAGIPVGTETPLKFSFPDVLGPLLPQSTNRNRFFSELVNVLNCYWGVLKGFAILSDDGYIAEAEYKRAQLDSFVNFMERTHGIPREKVLKSTGLGLETRMLNAKWFADATMVKMRSVWDKMLRWLSYGYYGVELTSDKWGSIDKGKVGQFNRQVVAQINDGPERELASRFVRMACELNELREYRDNDLHYTSPRILEALGRPGEDEDMFSLFLSLCRELVRVAEAMVVCFACMLARADKMPTNSPLLKEPHW